LSLAERGLGGNDVSGPALEFGADAQEFGELKAVVDLAQQRRPLRERPPRFLHPAFIEMKIAQLAEYDALVAAVPKLDVDSERSRVMATGFLHSALYSGELT
jgi:hypothetical protein